MLQEAYYLFSSWDPVGRAPLLSGVAYYDDSIIVGTEGLLEWVNENPGVDVASVIREGRFSCVWASASSLVAWCDDMAQETIYYYEDAGRWAFSNSFLALARELRTRGVSLSVHKGALAAFDIGNYSLFGGQLVSHQTPIREIRVLSNNHQLKVTDLEGRQNFSLDHRPRQAQVETLDPESYIGGLQQFVSSWKGRFSAMAEKNLFDHYKVGLSGGYDSRITFALAYQGLSGSTDRYQINSDPKKLDDLGPANAIRELYQIENGFKPSNPVRVNGEKAYDLWKLGNVGVYLPVYLARREIPAKAVNVHGGHFRAHAYAKMSAQQRLSVIQKKLPGGNVPKREFAEVWCDAFREMDVDMDDPRAMHQHYLNFRARFHYGRSWYKNLSNIVMTPLLSAKLKALSDAFIWGGGDMQQVTYDLMYLLDPQLTEMPFDREEKRFPSEVKARSLVKGCALAGRVPIGGGRVYGGGITGNDTEVAADGRCRSLAELGRAVSDRMVEEFRTEGVAAVDCGLADHLSFLKMRTVVKLGRESSSTRALLSWWVTRAEIANLTGGRRDI